MENDKIDGAARKLIRSYVMKGKNIGKTRPRPTSKADVQEPFAGEIYGKSTEGGEMKIISVPRTVGNSLSSFTFPCKMQPYMKELIYQCKRQPPCLHKYEYLLTLFSLLYI